jgi:dimethylargininase
MGNVAIVRPVSSALARCELSFVERAPIDVARARVQHAAYEDALRSRGCEIVRLPQLDDYPDSVFVEDTALVFDELAVLTRPGAPSRRGEVESVATVLGRYRPLARIEGEGTLDGGDVLRLGREVYVGRSARRIVAGSAELRAHIAGPRSRVHALDTRDCLHLKSAVTQVAEDAVLFQPRWLDPAPFSALRIIEVHPDEEHGANAVRVGGGIVYPDCFPRTLEKLRAAGVEATTVDVSELQKAEGAVTCCSLIVAGQGAVSVRSTG